MTDAPAEQVTIQQALSAVMGDVRSVGKSERNQAQGFNFRGIDAVVNAVGPSLRTHGVVVMPRVVDLKYGSVEIGKNRTAMAHALVTVEYTFIGPAGDLLRATTVGEAMDAGDKTVAKAMSVAFRICLLQALALPTTEPDPDAVVYERSEPLDLSTVKRQVWTAAIDAKIVERNDPRASEAMAQAYRDDQGGDLATATAEELHGWLLALQNRSALQNSLGVTPVREEPAQAPESAAPAPTPTEDAQP